MIYCNKRKEHIKPEVGQVWAVYDNRKKEVINYVEIIHICPGKRPYPMLVKREDNFIFRFAKNGLHRFDHLQLGHLQKPTKSPLQWHPIETAPRDGTPVLAVTKDLIGEYGDYVVIFWDKNIDRWAYYNFNDWINEDNEGEYCWMPLPEPPEMEESL